MSIHFCISNKFKIPSILGTSFFGKQGIICHIKAFTFAFEFCVFNEMQTIRERKKTVLFLTQKAGKGTDEPSQCGVGIRGMLTGDILSKGGIRYNFVTVFVSSEQDVKECITNRVNLNSETEQVIGVIYNFHSMTTPWMIPDSIRTSHKDIFHAMIHYDVNQAIIDNYSPELWHGFRWMITDNDKLDLSNSKNVLCVARSLPCTAISDGIMSHTSHRAREVPWIGFQGFGLRHKGIHRIAERVVMEYDEAIIRLHMPSSLFIDPYGYETIARIREVRSIISTKPGIKLEVSLEFMKEEEIVNWLAENDVNCYFTDYIPGAGIASSPDYALAARRPIAITRSNMNKHMWDLTPSIEIEKSSLKEIIGNGVYPLRFLYEKYSRDEVVRNYETHVEYMSKTLFTEKQTSYSNNKPRSRVLFLNHGVVNCGVYQYGKRLFNVLNRGKCIFEIVYKEINNLSEYEHIISEFTETTRYKETIILYNYHEATMPWLHRGAMSSNIKHIGIPHETTRQLFDKVIDIDPSSGKETSIPRPLIEWDESNKYISNNLNLNNFIKYGIEDDITIIGSFGFGFDNKGFHKIVTKVCREYDAAIIKILIPVAHYDPYRERTIYRTMEKCNIENTKPGVKLLFCTEFMSESELMAFLGSNSLNLFMYDKLEGRGISSAVDYAISSGKPLGISSSHMFRHIWCEDIDAETKTCKDLIDSGGKWVNSVKCQGWNDKIVYKINKIISGLLKRNPEKIL